MSPFLVPELTIKLEIDTCLSSILEIKLAEKNISTVIHKLM